MFLVELSLLQSVVVEVVGRHVEVVGLIVEVAVMILEELRSIEEIYYYQSVIR